MLDSRPKLKDKAGTSGSKTNRRVGLGDMMDLVDYLDPEMLEPFSRDETVSKEMMHFKRIHLIGNVVAPSPRSTGEPSTAEHQVNVRQEVSPNGADLLASLADKKAGSGSTRGSKGSCGRRRTGMLRRPRMTKADRERMEIERTERVLASKTLEEAAAKRAANRLVGLRDPNFAVKISEVHLTTGTTRGSAEGDEEIETKYSGSEMTRMTKPRTSSQNSAWATEIASVRNDEAQSADAENRSENNETASDIDGATIEMESEEPATTPIAHSISLDNRGDQSLSAATARVAGSMKPKGILKQPTQKFPDDPDWVREGVAPLVSNPASPTRQHDATLTGTLIKAPVPDVPPGATRTRIDRRLVNPAALKAAKERFEERVDCVIVLRVLTKEEIQRLADRTWEIRGMPDGLLLRWKMQC